MPSAVVKDFYNARARSSRHPARAPAAPPGPRQPLVPVPSNPTARYHRALQCLDGLDAFKSLVQRTSHRSTDPDWSTPLTEFKSILAALRLRVTLKTHFVTGHLSQFMVEHAAGLSLCAFSEQCFETTHHRWTKYEERFNIPKRYNRHCADRLHAAVSAWAGSRVPDNAKFVSRGRGFNQSADGVLANSSSSVSRGSHASEASMYEFTCVILETLYSFVPQGYAGALSANRKDADFNIFLRFSSRKKMKK